MEETKKKVPKKGKNEQVDSIIIILIVIIVLAVIAGGIVLWVSGKTPDVQPLDRTPGLVTTEKGSYKEYLEETKTTVGSKTIPLKAQTDGSQVINYVSAILGDDNALYFVSTNEAKNTITIPGSNLLGIKYSGAEFVDVFDVKTATKNYLIGLTDEGILISFDLTDIENEPETFKGTEAIEVYETNNQVGVKCFDKTTKIIIA